MLIFGREDESIDDEFDPNDDGSPIYVDKMIGDLKMLPALEVIYEKNFFFSVSLFNRFDLNTGFKSKAFFRFKKLNYRQELSSLSLNWT